ncbi:MAG: hypothetical protein HY268_17390 [Deltaproteobacteria bacterium]|nr:hypothetical protein [Deltaproteobacteria bacterium]
MAAFLAHWWGTFLGEYVDVVVLQLRLSWERGRLARWKNGVAQMTRSEIWEGHCVLGFATFPPVYVA